MATVLMVSLKKPAYALLDLMEKNAKPKVKWPSGQGPNIRAGELVPKRGGFDLGRSVCHAPS